jgi:hypothetical protein
MCTTQKSTQQLDLNTYTKTRRNGTECCQPGRHSLNLRSILRRQSHLALTPMNIHPILATSDGLKLRCLRDHELVK